MLPCIFQAYVLSVFVDVSHRTYIAVRQSLFLHIGMLVFRQGVKGITTANLHMLKIEGDLGFAFCRRMQHNSCQVNKINQGLKLFVVRGLFRLDNCAEALLLLVSQAQPHIDGSCGGD